MAADRFDFLRTAPEGERWVWLAETMETVQEKQTDHEGRLRVLERWRWVIIGAVVVIGAAWQWVVDAVRGRNA